MEVKLDSFVMEYSDQNNCYYFNCPDCDHELTLPYLWLKQNSITLICDSCKIPLTLIYYNHLIGIEV
jgi:transcription elongation factor Elf1